MIADTQEPFPSFRRFVREWFRLLSVGSISDALALIDEPNSYGILWTWEEILIVLREYEHTDAVRVSDPDTLAGDGRPNIGEFSDGSGFYFDHEVPLNGQWSDLIAQFEFLRRQGGFAVVLQDIHVL